MSKKLTGITKVHFIGVGGISLSALAKLMLLFGKEVTGSDISYSSNIVELMEKGADIWIGNKPDLVGKPDLVVYSSAINKDDPELNYCINNNIPTMERHIFLGELSKLFNSVVAIGGTHGKTTACAYLSYIFKEAKQKFCGHIGGEVNGLSNLYYSGKEYFITEACEYKKSLLSLPANIALILNAECDHPDTYSSINEIYDTFDKFLFQKNDCLAMVCSDCAYYNNHIKTMDKPVITFGSKSGSDFLISNVYEYKNGYYSFELSYMQTPIVKIEMSIPGFHNIYNVVAAISISYLLHIDNKTIKNAVEGFKGVKRRFEKKGMIRGAEVFHDYAHHPSEIKAVLKSAKGMTKGKLIAVFQPHTFSRTSLLLDDFVRSFNGCDEIYIVKEYSARENKEQGKSAYDLFKKLRNTNSFYYDEIITLAKHLVEKASPFDMILILGAGDIDKLCDLLV